MASNSSSLRPSLSRKARSSKESFRQGLFILDFSGEPKKITYRKLPLSLILFYKVLMIDWEGFKFKNPWVKINYFSLNK